MRIVKSSRFPESSSQDRGRPESRFIGDSKLGTHIIVALLQAIRHREAVEGRREGVQTDSLTSLGNFSAFRDTLGFALEAARNHEESMALAIVSVEGLGESEESKQADDDALKMVSGALQNVMQTAMTRVKVANELSAALLFRLKDRVAPSRLKGNQFVVLLPGFEYSRSHYEDVVLSAGVEEWFGENLNESVLMPENYGFSVVAGILRSDEKAADFFSRIFSKSESNR